MNSTSQFPPDADQPRDAPHSTPPSSGGGFFQWARDTGIRRNRDDRWFAGVASGIAHKAGIDPLIVRGLFVIFAIVGGPGVLLYLAGWLLLPDDSGMIHTEELIRGRANPGVVIAAVIIAISLISGLFTGARFGILRWEFWNISGAPRWLDITFSWVFWIGIIAAAAYLVHLIFLERGKTQLAKQQASPTAGDEAPHTSFTETATQWGQTVNDQANTWSVEYANRHEQRKLGRGHVLITIALALIAAGVSALWVYGAGVDASVSLPSPSAPAIIAALLAATSVIAISMIIAGVRGKSTGGIGFAGFLGVVALMITAVLPWGTNYYAFGNHTVSQSTPATFTLVGDTTVELGVYDEDVAQGQVEINQIAGNLTVQAPETRPTTITIDVLAGSVEERHSSQWREQSGVFNRRTVVVNEDATGPTLDVHVRLLAGTITVE